MSEVRFESCFDVFIWVGCASQSQWFSQMLFTLGITASFRNHMKRMSALLGKRAHAPTHKIVHMILNCTPYTSGLQKKLELFNKTIEETSLPGPSHLVRHMSSKAPLLPNRTPQTAAVPGLSKLPPASVSLVKQLAYLSQVIFQGALLNLAHLSRLVQGTGKPQV